MHIVRIILTGVAVLCAWPALAASPKPGQATGAQPDTAQKLPIKADTGDAARTKALRDATLPRVRATTSNQKIEELKRAGVNALPGQLGVPYRLNMPTPTTSTVGLPRGFLILSLASETSHAPPGFAALRSKHTITGDGPPYDQVPSVWIRLLFDANRVQLIDCRVDPEGMQLEFEHAIEYFNWQNKTVVTATSGHVFYVIPKGPATHYSDVRLRATAQSPANKYWRFFGCEITPVS